MSSHTDTPAKAKTIATAVTNGVHQASAADAGALQVTLAAAFYEDPIFGWLIGADESRQMRLERYFSIELGLALADGCVWTSEGLTGAALCMPPGRWRLPLRVMIAHSAGFTGVFRARLPRALGLLTAIERRHLREPHYYFANIGVAPEAQGQGLGSSLMRPTLERCDREGLPAYLEASSEHNARLYERLGFVCTNELRFMGSPPLRLMVRAPQPNHRAP